MDYKYNDEKNSLKNEIKDIVDLILADYGHDRDIDKMDIFNQPDRDAVKDIVIKLIRIIYPGYYRDKVYKSYNDSNRIAIVIEDVIYNLQKQIAIAFRHSEDYEETSEETLDCGARRITHEFFKQIPKIREYVDTDVQACYDGDPAAYSKEEIILSYPGLFATTVNRIAHELYLLKVPLIPRIMTEYAHSKTGIDIHPGATMGKYLMIDHGTGIVIGETSIIGEHVKIYQGVTIGGLSTRGGQALKGSKRHPTIEDDVTIYSGASILGGETVIGKGSVIGANAFITSSVPAASRVSMKNN
ncbi:serine O-acetyltransferase EpsC [Butyrivibrio sp. INlla21]|uniref:serine O-acetyltransferase EpsC n=1 Tax=Butyrivibrio sp. INlla21 TaxID=1520811 RepID=UPI0008E5EFA3|nr:serine O-acetyltransferase EpsC [Butyrivibrio sp. INlla21]SFU58138.1 serine O-acetyltransferase [Butyrivibrio sp. INlla21]